MLHITVFIPHVSVDIRRHFVLVNYRKQSDFSSF